MLRPMTRFALRLAVRQRIQDYWARPPWLPFVVPIAGLAAVAVSLAVVAARGEPAPSPAQVLQERSTALVAGEIGQLVIERAQLRATVEVLREALAKSEARVKELEQRETER